MENIPEDDAGQNRSWSDEESDCLITLWGENIDKLESMSHRRSIYEKIAASLHEAGHPLRSWSQIQKKIANLKDTYRKKKASITGSSPASWRFYYKIHAILGPRPFYNTDVANAKEASVYPPTEGAILPKRWKNIRDSYSREQRRQKNVKSGSSANRQSPYVYTNQLSFLNKCSSGINATGSKTQENADTIIGSSEEDTKGPFGVGEKSGNQKRSKNADLATALKPSLQSSNERQKLLETDADRHFLLSLLPHMKKVPESRKLSTQIEVMNVILRSIDYATGYDTPYHGISHPPPLPISQYNGSRLPPPLPTYGVSFPAHDRQQNPHQQYSSTSRRSATKVSQEQFSGENDHRPESTFSTQSYESNNSADSEHSAILM